MTDAMETVRAARASDKLSAHYLRAHLFSDFVELHGDRQGADDPAIVGGIGLFAGQPVTVITTSRGHKLEERLAKHFGQPEPAGYRKAARLVKDAARFKRPVLLFIDTAGAFPGKEAEYAGQGQAIAQCLTDIGQAKTPIISVIFGEGGSGGALALACGDEVWMMENSMYSVLSPEGFASILWKDAGRAAEAAELLGLTPEALLKRQVIEGVIKQEGSKSAQCREIARVLEEELAKLQKLSVSSLLNRRYERFRKF